METAASQQLPFSFHLFQRPNSFWVVFPDHRPSRRVHSVQEPERLQRRVPGHASHGRGPQQHRQDAEALRRPRPVPHLPDPKGNEVRPLSGNHTQGEEIRRACL